MRNNPSPSAGPDITAILRECIRLRAHPTWAEMQDALAEIERLRAQPASAGTCPPGKQCHPSDPHCIYPECQQKPASAGTEQDVEIGARILCKMRGGNPDALHWHEPNSVNPSDATPWPTDGLLANGKPAHYGWRIQAPYVRKILSALPSRTEGRDPATVEALADLAMDVLHHDRSEDAAAVQYNRALLIKRFSRALASPAKEDK